MPKKVKRTTLTLPPDLYEKLALLAEERGQSPSAMIGGWVYELPSPRRCTEMQEKQTAAA